MVSALGAAFFARPARAVAPELIGCVLEANGVAGVIVEVERYEHWDAASHSFRGPTPRSQVMFGPAGHLYVYRSYGMHWCVNFVCGPPGHGAAVLVRAVEPIGGLEVMQARRGSVAVRDLCRGPGHLAEAFGITGALNGRPVSDTAGAGGVRVMGRDHEEAVVVVRGPRIGITRDPERAWRYVRADSPWVSGPRSARTSMRDPVAA